MTPKGQLQRNLRTITWTIAAIGCWLTILFASVFLYARQAQEDLSEEQLALHGAMIELQIDLGYGGLIHHFKNWVMRPDEAEYRDRAIAAADRALAALDQLETLLHKSGIGISLDAKRSAVREYRDRIDVVSEMHANGASVREIDRAVRVDDSPALNELPLLRERVMQRMREQQAELVRRRDFVLLMPSLGTVAFLSGLLLLMRQRSRLRSEYDATRVTELEQFTSVAAHDLRAPLRQIAALSEFAREDIDDPSLDKGVVRQHLETISERASKLDALIKAVFRYIMIDGASEEITEVDLRQTVTDIARLHVPDGGTVRLEGDFPVVRAQHVELEIILRNLISNAVKHHPDNRPNIIVRYQLEKRTHRFEVEDDGPGIPGEHAARVFDMFWSLHKPDEKTEVSGLGLALVRRIVTRWGTQLSLRNAEPRGAVFSFTMPVF